MSVLVVPWLTYAFFLFKYPFNALFFINYAFDLITDIENSGKEFQNTI